MAVEKTVIKDTKGTGDIVGITRQQSSLLRWSLTRHVLADFCSKMRSRSGVSAKQDDSHDDAKRAAMKRDEEPVKLLIDHLLQRMTDPFEVEEHHETLINFQ